jgi:phosphate transport system substrate-binding protein
MRRFWRAAVFAALVVPDPALAQDVTLTSRDGSLVLPGMLQGYDGEFYRVLTSYGLLTVDGQGVICDGPACPDLTAPKAVIRILGADAGTVLLPGLFAAFARSRGLDIQAGDPAILTDPATGKVLAEMSFAAAAPEAARDALVAGRAELVVAAAPDPSLGSRALALDALLPIVAPGNPTLRISTTDLAKALAGKVTNWAEVGGPDMPLVLHALAPGSDLDLALAARLGQPLAAAETHASMDDLAAAVARDPWALAVTGQAHLGAARPLPLTDSCGFPLSPSPLSVKAEDFPLALPVFLLTPPRRLPLVAREFLEFLALPEAQQAIATAGFVDRAAERQPMTADGLRLINAIKGAGEETTLADLQRLALVMEGADRLSLTFRFEDGSTRLDAHSQENVRDLALMIGAGLFKGEALLLAGFSDGSGSAAANLELSQSRAVAVLAALQQAGPELTADQMPAVAAFGEALPMACDETGPGRRLNRRVELWVRPDFVAATDSPAP